MTQPITHDEMCASRQGRACNCGAETAESIVTMLQAELAEAIRERDEAQAEAAAALGIAEDARKERDEAKDKLETWFKAAEAGAVHHTTIQQLPADEGLIRAIVDAIENEHEHTERLLGLFSCPTVNAALLDAKERMKRLTGMLERLANPPIFMPRET